MGSGSAGRRSAATGADGAESRRSLVPDEVISLNELRRVSVPIYGMERCGDLFSPRQALALTTLARLVREAAAHCARGQTTGPGGGLAEAVATCLALSLSKLLDLSNALTRWKTDAECPVNLFARQAIGMMWDYAEAVTTCDSSGSWSSMNERTCHSIEAVTCEFGNVGHTEWVSATVHPLPDDAAAALVTDPPYYDAVPYAYLSDFFYVWMRRMLADVHPALFHEAGVPKDAEIVVDRPHQLSQSTKDIAFYERELTRAFAEGRRVLAPAGVGTIVFASKTTASWEAILKAVIDAGFVITGSWPIDTESRSSKPQSLQTAAGAGNDRHREAGGFAAARTHALPYADGNQGSSVVGGSSGPEVDELLHKGTCQIRNRRRTANSSQFRGPAGRWLAAAANRRSQSYASRARAR